MSSKIKNNLFNSPKIFDSWGNKSIINKSRRRNAKQISGKNRLLFKFREDELSSAFIPTENYTERLKALKKTGNGNCLYNSASVLIQGDESVNLIILRLSDSQ